MIKLKRCTVQWTQRGVLTKFYGAETEAYPHPEDPHYFVIAHRCGYGDDLMRYAREHDFCHSFLANEINDGSVSRVLFAHAVSSMHQPLPDWGTAHPIWLAVQEEALVMNFQAWLRANRDPIIAGVDWLAMKEKALALIKSEDKSWEQEQ